MAKRVLDYDPFTGMTTTFDYDPISDITTLGYEQDVTAFVEYGKELQKHEDYSKQGIKNGWWHYCIFPPIIIQKWLIEHGVNVFDRNHQKKVYSLINQPEYRYLKTTTKMHRG
jgi:hypothetical protein